jgi:hypothetical protein
MPIFNVRAPDGSLLKINGPEDATDEELIQIAERSYQPKKERTIGGNLKELGKGLIPGGIGLLETAGIGASALLEDDKEKIARKFIKEKAAAGKEYFAPEAGYEESVGRKLGEGLGSTLPFFALGPLKGAGRTAGTGLGVAAGAGEARRAAEEKGATAEERSRATLLGAPTGLLDLLAPQITLFKGVIGNALTRGGVEGATEAAQKIAQNLIAKGVYDPKQDVLAGSGEEGAYGAGVGALASLVMDLALGRRGRTTTDTKPSQAAPQQAPLEREIPAPEQVAQAPTVPMGGMSADRAAALRAEADAEAAANAPKLALGMNQPFTPVGLPDGSVALTQQDLDDYEREQFEKQYAPQPNLNQVVPAATPPQLGYSPLPGVPKVSTSGNVALTPDQELQAQYAPQPVRMTQEVWSTMSPEEQDAFAVKAQLDQQARIDAAQAETAGKKATETGFKGKLSESESEALGLVPKEKKKKAGPAIKATENPENIGVIGTDDNGLPIPGLLSEGAKPFISKDVADYVRKNQPTMKSVQLKDGSYVLSPKTEAEMAREDKTKIHLATAGAKGEPIDASAFIAGRGGLSFDTQPDVYSRDENPKIGNRNLFQKNGVGLDQAGEMLQEAGYFDNLPEGETYTENDVIEAITGKIYRPEDEAFLAEREIKKREKAEEAVEIKASLDSQIAEDMGYPNTPKGIADSFLERAIDQGIDVESIQEQAAREAQGQPEDAYHDRVSALARDAMNNTSTLYSINKDKKPTTATAKELKMQKDLEGKSMVQAAQYLITNAPNAFQKFVAKKVLNVIKEMEARGVDFNFEVQTGDTRNSGLYDGEGLTTHFFNKEGKPLRIQVLLNGAPVFKNQRGYPSGLSYKTLMHELLHVATSAKVWYLSDTSPAVKQLNDLYQIVAVEYKKQRANGTLPEFLKNFNKGYNNALSDANEMLTWSMTDERMQNWMNDIKVGDKTVFSKIIDLIRQVLGMPKPFETALDRLVRTTDSLLDMDTQVLEDGMIAKGKSFGGKQTTKKMPTEQQTLFSKRAQEMFNKLQTGKSDITNTPAFKRWFGKSKIVNKDGSPKPLYHATFSDVVTPKVNFGSDEYRRWGFHVGSIEAAESRMSIKEAEDSYNRERSGNANPNIMPLWIKAERPLRLDENRSGRWGVDDIMRAVMEKAETKGVKGITDDMIDQYNNDALDIDAITSARPDVGDIDYDPNQEPRSWSDQYDFADGERSQLLNAFLQQAGYDSIVYKNEFEGGGDSYIVFDPKQVKSVFNEGAFSPDEVRINKLQFGKKAEPTPTGNGQASLDNLTAMGRVVADPDPSYLAKVKESWDNARDNPKATAEAARSSFQRFRDRIETWAFSSDAALNNAIRREVMASTAGQEEKLGLLLNTSLSQTVHSDAVASLFLQKGGISYDKDLHKWVGRDTDDNFVTLSKQLDAIAEKNGLTKPQIELIAHAAFEAKRTQSLIKFNNELAAEIDAIKREAASKRATSPVAASALSEKAQRMKDEFKYIHLDDAQIAAGMAFFKIHPELNEVVKTWNKIRDNAADALVESGLWSRGDAEFLLSNADYVPFYREDQLEQGKGPKEFIRGLKVQAKERKLKGSDKPVNDIFDNQVRWVQYSINRAVRNRSAIALADTAVSVGAAKQVASLKDGDNVTRIWRDGKEEFYDMADPMFMEAFNGLEAVVIPSWKWASTLANTLRQSVVMYPLFSVAQVPQDAFAAMYSSGLKPQYALRIPILAVKEFIQTLRGKSKSHEELKNVGAVGVRDFTSAMVREDAEIFSGLRAPPGFLGKLKYGLNHIAMAADNAVRQAVFEAAEAQGLSKAEAFEKSFEVFNVRRKGSSKTLALASQLIPFFNAYLAAQNVAYKTITGRGISPTERVNALQTLAATTASVMTMSLLYSILNGDDEDYLNKPAVQRDRLLMIPGTGGMSIPLRSDFFTMPKIITEHMYLLMTDKGYEDGRKFRESMTNSLANSLLSPTAVPQAIKPIIEVAINRDFFQGRPLIGTYQQKLETERQFTDSTSELGKFIGSSGLISPIAVDHLIRGMLGSVGGLTLYMTSAMLDNNPDAPRPSLSMQDAIATLPGMSGFLAKTYENGLKRDFYALKEEVDKAANTFNDMKTRSPQDIEGFLAKEENIARLGLQKTTNKIADELSKIRKSISFVTNAEMPADEKRAILQDLKETERDMLKAVDVKELRALGMM